jgi:hypothetical protein
MIKNLRTHAPALAPRQENAIANCELSAKDLTSRIQTRSWFLILWPQEKGHRKKCDAFGKWAVSFGHPNPGPRSGVKKGMVENTQQQNAVKRTELLLAELKGATSFLEVKAALVDYVEDLDCRNPEDDAPFVFDDSDFAKFFIRSLELRGKGSRV